MESDEDINNTRDDSAFNVVSDLLRESNNTASAATNGHLPDADEDVLLEAKRQVQRMRCSYLNERQAPELLPYQTELIRVLRELVKEQEELLDAQSDVPDVTPEQHERGGGRRDGAALRGATASARHADVAINLRRHELHRVGFLLRAYHRTRLWKIEAQAKYLLSSEAMAARMSAQERSHAEKYQQLLHSHFHTAFLHLLTERLRSTNEADGDVDTLPAPNLQRFVFCRVRRDIGALAVGSGDSGDTEQSNGSEDASQTMTLARGDYVCVRYWPVRNLLLQDAIELV